MRAYPVAQSPLMRVPEVAELCEVDEETVRVWVREGKLAARRNPGGRVLIFRRADVYTLLGLPTIPAQNENGPAGAATPDEP
ncbi:helix-turn-helix domain-containing protein [Streptosporangium sp. NPDC051022]|uniref:helix-turn-helix domain-containing protein n=1 Tax=Streptosporangium sp. NPDC051022 TaxID=3155752 RepID=UPI003444A69A